MFKLGLTDTVEPSSLSFDIKKIESSSSSIRMADGSYVDDVITIKRVVNIKWDALSWMDLSAIMQIVNQSSFSVTFPDPISGQVQVSDFFLVNRSTPVAFPKDDVDELGGLVRTYYWQDVGITIEER